MELPSEPGIAPQFGKADPQAQLVAPVNCTGRLPQELAEASNPSATVDPSCTVQPTNGGNSTSSQPDSTTDSCADLKQQATVAKTTDPMTSSIPCPSGIPRFTRTPITSKSVFSSNDLADRPGDSHRNGRCNLHTSEFCPTPASASYGLHFRQHYHSNYPGAIVSPSELVVIRRQTSNLSSVSSNGKDRSRPPSSTTTGSAASVSGFRYDRVRSQNPCRSQDNVSDGSSSHSAGGTPKVITSKVNSLANVRHKPGGGNVNIVDSKVDYGPVKSKCNSLANVKHTPGGGNVQIPQEKLSFSSVESRVQSLKNVKHIPSGGQVKIVSEKLQFSNTAKSKIGSMKNVAHNPGGGDVRIYNESLPWLKYNKPNLPSEEKARINKRPVGGHSTDMTSSATSGSQ